MLRSFQFAQFPLSNLAKLAQIKTGLSTWNLLSNHQNHGSLKSPKSLLQIAQRRGKMLSYGNNKTFFFAELVQSRNKFLSLTSSDYEECFVVSLFVQTTSSVVPPSLVVCMREGGFYPPSRTPPPDLPRFRQQVASTRQIHCFQSHPSRCSPSVRCVAVAVGPQRCFRIQQAGWLQHLMGPDSYSDARAKAAGLRPDLQIQKIVEKMMSWK